jgi:NAD(P)-dependent dehydrogenase (short-subunit alcohol dehydrogenase family)
MSDWTAADLPSFAGRTAIITGANSGLGAVTARELARNGAAIIMAVRNTKKGEAAAQQMTGNVDVRQLDLQDLSSVRQFADGIDKADILINFDDLNWKSRRYSPWLAYSQSKLANLLFTSELQRRLESVGSPLRALAAHPGYSHTNLQGTSGRKLGDALMSAATRVVATNADFGARQTLYAASQDLPGNTFVGPRFGYVGRMQAVGRSRRAQSAATATALWELSEQLTGTKFPL